LTGRGRWRRAAFIAVTALPFVFLTAFVAYPLWQQVGGSFFSWYQLKPRAFDGVRNYVALFADELVPVATLHTAFYLLLTVPVEVALGLGAAWMVLRVRRGQAALAVVFLVPLVVPWTVAGTFFYGLFTNGGVVDHIGHVLFGTSPQFLWLYHPRLAFASIVVFGIWKGAPWCFLLLLGALSASPVEVFEAARIDGARGASFWWRVVVPSVRPMLAFVVVLRFLAEAQTYDSVAALTNGGPGFPGATELLAFYGDKVAFGYYNFGEASALGTLLGTALVIVAALGWLMAYPRPIGRRRSFGPLPARPASSAVPEPARDSAIARQHRWREPSRPPGLVRSLLGSSKVWSGRARAVVLVIMALLVLAPFAGGAPNWMGRNEFAGTFWPAIDAALGNTLIVSAATLAGTLLLAVPAAYLLAFKQFRLRNALFLFVLFCLAIPGIVFIFPQFEETVRLHLVNKLAGVVVLYITTNLPLAIFFLRPAFAGVPRALVEAMRVDGASELGILMRLILRYAGSTIIALSVLVVVWVWGEVPIAQALLNNNSTFTLPLQMFNGSIGNPNAVYLISMAVPLALFLVTQRFFRRGLVSGSLL
jgi:ABC-type sugar transport system permease subunit